MRYQLLQHNRHQIQVRIVYNRVIKYFAIILHEEIYIGVAYGCPGHFRLNFVIETNRLKDAMDRIHSFITARLVDG